jgi:uncharacterized protein YecE (DUF72 family)
MQIEIGCSGWSYREWKGLFYPLTVPQKEWFSYYAKRFSTVEINVSFYRTPSLQTLQKWYSQAPDGFYYILKAPKLLTHLKRFKDCKADLQGFYSLGETLQEKLGGFLFQFPASFTCQPSRLERIVQTLDPVYRNIVEFRHPSWWHGEVCQALERVGIIFCSVNSPDLPQNIILSQGRVYLRLHGNRYKGSYGKNILQQLKAKIEALHPHEVWIYFNNTMDGDAPFDALCLKQLFAC